MLNDEVMLTPNQVSEKLGVSLRTLYQWEKDGILVPYRRPGVKGRKFYSQEQIEEFWNNIEQQRLDRIARAKEIAQKKKEEKEKLKAEKLKAKEDNKKA
ncbi:MAG: helix-turn-helix domain-containing protein [Clostridia bacterium]